MSLLTPEGSSDNSPLALAMGIRESESESQGTAESLIKILSVGENTSSAFPTTGLEGGFLNTHG